MREVASCDDLPRCCCSGLVQTATALEEAIVATALGSHLDGVAGGPAGDALEVGVGDADQTVLDGCFVSLDEGFERQLVEVDFVAGFQGFADGGAPGPALADGGGEEATQRRFAEVDGSATLQAGSSSVALGPAGVAQGQRQELVDEVAELGVQTEVGSVHSDVCGFHSRHS